MKSGLDAMPLFLLDDLLKKFKADHHHIICLKQGFLSLT